MLESPLMLRGHPFNVAGVVPVHARRDGPKRTAGAAKTPSKQHVEFQTLVRQLTIIVASGLAAHLGWFGAVRVQS